MVAAAAEQRALEQARALYQAARYSEAGQICLELVSRYPSNGSAHTLLGLINLRRGNLGAAHELFAVAAKLDPDDIAAWLHLTAAQLEHPDPQAAVSTAEQALQRHPSNAELHRLLGLAYRATGDLPRSIAALRRAIDLQPRLARSYEDLADALAAAGGSAEALQMLASASRLEPHNPRIYYNQGVLLQQLGRLVEARTSFEAAIRLRPEHAESHNNLGLILSHTGLSREAVVCFQRAIALRPGFAAALINLANAWQDLGELERARQCLQEAVRLNPSSVSAWINYGNVLQHLGATEAAIESYLQAHSLDPQDPEVEVNLAHAFLRLGDFERGWPLFEARLRHLVPLTSLGPPVGVPRWDGQLIPGLRLLLLAEQGLGDTIQFARYAARLRSRGLCPMLQCTRSLHRLFANSGLFEKLVVPADGTTAEADAWLPLMSLPGVLPQDMLATSGRPYLQAHPDDIARWRQRLPARGRKIGIVWQGNPAAEKMLARGRSAPLEAFEPLSRLSDTLLVCLQKGAATEQVERVSFCSELWVPSGLDLIDAFTDTAALITQCELVVSTDTAVAHLAGAMGATTWLALHAPADWRWQREGSRTPWYENMRLFRQRTPGDWSGVFSEMAAALER